ncbi:MAG: alpha/beta fold hydrolase [Ignavibacterium sp.]|nr:alpha/beta fold hydrolase [Ignavibacterium sp.]
MRRTFYLILSFLLSFHIYSNAQSIQEFYQINSFQTESGYIINNCKIGYRTFGSISEDSSNVVLYCSWFGGNSEAIGILINKYKFIDTTKYFIIAVDALGNGVSSSISNSDISDSVFYSLSISDMVNANYKLLTEHFGLNRIYAAIGGSMGSMQVLQMAVTYPEFAKKIIAYVATPRLSSSDLLWMATQQNLIESSLNCGMSEREVSRLSEILSANFARTPDYVTKDIDRSEFKNYLDSFDKESKKIFTLQNYLTQLKAMMKHDISIDTNESMTEASEKIKAKMFIIVSKSDLLLNPSEAINLANLTSSRLLILDNNCGHLAVSCEIDRVREEIAKFLVE